MALVMCFLTKVLSTKVRLVVLCDYRDIPVCTVFRWEQYPREAETIFASPNREMSMMVPDLEKQEPGFVLLKDYVGVTVKGRRFKVTVSLQREIVKNTSAEVEVFDVLLGVDTS